MISPTTFTTDTADKTGLSRRTIQQEIQIAEKLDDEVKEMIRGTALEDNKTELIKLARMDAKEQAKAVKEIKSGKAKSVSHASVLSKKATIESAKAQAVAGKSKICRVGCLDYLKTAKDNGNKAGYDLLLTDPPYMTDVDDIYEFANSWLGPALAAVKPSGRAYICIGAYPEELHAYLNAWFGALKNSADISHLTRENILVWTYRNTIGPAPKDNYKQNWQAILYFKGKEAAALDCPIMTEQFAVQDINAPDGRRGDRYHTWQKPDELAERLIRHSTKPGDSVFDPFTGTGTFLVVAAQLGRTGIGCEISDDMIAIAVQRGCEIE